MFILLLRLSWNLNHSLSPKYFCDVVILRTVLFKCYKKRAIFLTFICQMNFLCFYIWVIFGRRMQSPVFFRSLTWNKLVIGKKDKWCVFSKDFACRTKTISQSLSNRYEIFCTEYIIEDFNSQEKFWLDMTNSQRM